MGDRDSNNLADWQRERLEYFRNLAFARKQFERPKGGWDHEHCWICQAHFKQGDAYWVSVEPQGYELCARCHGRFRSSTSTHWESGEA